MRSALPFALAGALWAQGLPNPTDVLAQARDKIVASCARLPNYTCVQTVNRSYLRPPKQPVPFPSCAQLRAERDARDYRLDLFLTDRLRLDVKVSGGVEIGSWAGASQFDSKFVFDVVGRGPFGTGVLGTFLSDIFDNSGGSFTYDGVVLADGKELYQYGFQIPLGASHYLVHAGSDWQAIAYEGEVAIDRDSFDIRRLAVRSGSLPLESEACEVSTTADYAMVHFGRGDFLLPQQSRLHIISTSTAEDDVTTNYTGCREYQSESSISFGDAAPATAAANNAGTGPMKLPAGLPISVALAEPIDTDVAAAGDVVVEAVRKPVRAKGSKEVLIPKGATVRARIVKMQHWMMPPARFDIAIRLEAWETGGVSSPIFAEPDHSETTPGAGIPRRGDPIYLPPAAQPAKVRTLEILTDQKRAVVPRGFETSWITVQAPAGQ